MGKRAKQRGHRLGSDSFARLVGMARLELAQGDPTKFAREGSTIAGIRAGLLLSRLVQRWTVANALAREVTAQALHELGAERPSWLEGQREFTDTIITHCMRCRKPLRDDPDSLAVRFCSPQCSWWANAHTRRRTHDAEALNTSALTRATLGFEVTQNQFKK